MGAPSLFGLSKNYKYVNIQHDTIEGLRGIRGILAGCALGTTPRVRPGVGVGRERRATCLGQGSYRASLMVGPDCSAASKKSSSRNWSAPPRQHRPWRTTSRSGRCSACMGTRWSLQARALRVADYGVADILAMTFDDLESLTAPRGAFAQLVPRPARPNVALPESSCEGSQACWTWLPDSRPGHGRCQRRREPPDSSRPGAGCRRAGLLPAAG